MKSGEIIRQLQALDPTGELDCSVGNIDIHTISIEPAYWDGYQQRLILDPSNADNVIGVKYVSSGSKIVFGAFSIRDAISNDPDVPIDYSDLPPETAKRFRESDDGLRQATRDRNRQIELEHFQHYILNLAAEVSGADRDGLKRLAEEFFDAHLSRNDPLPEMIWKGGPHESRIGESYHDRRERDWSSRLELVKEGFDWQIRLKER